MQKCRFRAASLEEVPYFLIGLDVGAAESVNRLLGIADEKQLARHRLHATPVALSRIVGGEQQKNFRLQRIGVLELVDEQMGEARLKGPSHLRMAGEQIAGAEQKIDKIECARPALELLIACERAAELFAQQRREVRVGGPLKLVELVHQHFVPGPDGIAR